MLQFTPKSCCNIISTPLFCQAKHTVMMPAFDTVAPEYDRQFTDTVTGSLQRGQVWRPTDEEIAYVRNCANEGA